MKKLTLLTALLALALASCNKPRETDPADLAISAGQDIYNYGRPLHDYAMDPAIIAIRVNTLLAEAKTQGITDLTQQIKGGTPEVNYKQKLFGSNTVIAGTLAWTDQDVVTVTYTDYNINSYTLRSGTVRIKTGGKLLTDDDAEWIVHNKDAAKDNQLRWYFNGTDLHMDWTEDAYELNNLGGGVVSLTYSGHTCEAVGQTSISSSRNGDYTMAFSAGYADNPGYATYNAATMTLAGASSGNPINADAPVDYYAYNLVFQFKYGNDFISSGKEKVVFSALASLYPDSYPLDYVTVDWSWPNASQAVNNATLTYNGYQRTF